LKKNGCNVKVFDVRKSSEYQSQHLLGAENSPLNLINKHLSEFSKREFIVHCEGGYRSMIAASILKQRGFDNDVDDIPI
jgi:rhodanese-related sulfurtransferase